jgi:hypothetical protein
MQFLQRILGSAESRHAVPEGSKNSPADFDGNEELSDIDLDEVLGGLERIHFPDPIDLPEFET